MECQVPDSNQIEKHKTDRHVCACNSNAKSKVEQHSKRTE